MYKSKPVGKDADSNIQPTLCSVNEPADNLVRARGLQFRPKTIT
ncbi:MAG TPA: hypothetical protein VN950_25395 [Terriglobales bacterium]|nr:hypothetical protein [Terriglobales bacterium]